MLSKQVKAELRRKAYESIFSSKSLTKSPLKTPKTKNDSSTRKSNTPVRSPSDEIKSLQRKLKIAEGKFHSQEYAKSIGIKTPEAKKSSDTSSGHQPPISAVTSEISVASTLTSDAMNIKVDALASLKAQLKGFYEELEALMMEQNHDENIAIDSDALRSFNSQAEVILNGVNSLISEDDSTI
mmetsp:Transcript_10347/g.21642  ORF Transcript_10347/g.21642 Transcript_10347/m.21642 type:complete len:183 (-) Transcript_10347:444-992(-)